ncbi:EAL domain-containing protein [Massilia sp. CF038]|uniref:EAL domain-containing protein n=1 Tax=Massilia sp. CF038 TaxID=1881045 RepID=UPI000916B397|nr:EAL domain-containing protein [Massilia sp. CF038]SHG64648.1 EAL domain, c-di-GMP-specific phosphodiesterase class I (or its enzymatically inactive variant) [Massilia sp. CF038]
MSYPALIAYLARLSDPTGAPSTLWLNPQGQAEGRFFNCTLTSAFQPVRDVASGELRAYEAVARNAEPADESPSLWRQLDHAASDDESVELDRLCRMLHAINFFRQADGKQTDLYLSVHDRLLSAVSINHGHAFRRILDALGLPADRVVLQLPAVSPNQRWLLNYVTDNYKRNGFRMALNLTAPERATELLTQVQPAALRIDADKVSDDDTLARLITLAHKHEVNLIVRKVQTLETIGQLVRISGALGLPVQAQGYAIAPPRESIIGDALLQKNTPPDLEVRWRATSSDA